MPNEQKVILNDRTFVKRDGVWVYPASYLTPELIAALDRILEHEAPIELPTGPKNVFYKGMGKAHEPSCEWLAGYNCTCQ
jgi:hypothetical protein